MSDRALIEIGVAATRWRRADKERLAAARVKRATDEAAARFPGINLSMSAMRTSAAKTLSNARREELRARRALAKLCDQHLAAQGEVEDVLTVEEVRALPRLLERAKQPSFTKEPP